MRAAVFHAFSGPVDVETLPDPAPEPDGVVVRVGANGMCRSDWHAWVGHDPDVALPHVPGHELAGEVVAVGRDVRLWRAGDRVTVPFVLGCGACEPCRAGQQHVCDRQRQPGFSDPGSLAELVALPRADTNLVRLPDAVPFDVAASLGCRFGTAFRAVVDQARPAPGEWLAVHGCGGVGLSAVMVAAAAGARVVAVDVDPRARALAGECGAEVALDPADGDVADAVVALTGGGAHASIDALGSTVTALGSIRCLRTRGRHVQVGLMLGDDATPAVPLALLHSRELVLTGSHGMPAHAYPRMLALVETGRLDPGRLVTSRLTLTEGARHLTRMGSFPGAGIAVVTRPEG